MSPGSWNPTTVVQGIVWILLGLLLWPEPGTGGSEGRGLGAGQSVLQKYIAVPSMSSPIQGDWRPQAPETTSQGTQMLPGPQGLGRGRKDLGPEEQKSGKLPGGEDLDIRQEGEEFYLGRSREGHFRQREEQRNYSVDSLEKSLDFWVQICLCLFQVV